MKVILLRRSEFGPRNTHNYRTCRVPNCYLYLEVNNILHQDSIQIVEHLSGNEYDCNNEHTGRARLIRSHSSARFCFELSGNSN